jgi:hypothetical protein
MGHNSGEGEDVLPTAGGTSALHLIAAKLETFWGNPAEGLFFHDIACFFESSAGCENLPFNSLPPS